MTQNQKNTEPIGTTGDSWGETERFDADNVASQRTQRVDGYDYFYGGQDSSSRTQPISLPPPVLAWIAVTNGIRAGLLIQLNNPDGMAIGRDGQTNDIVLDDPAVSRQHAKIKMEEGASKRNPQFYIYDLASSNGTFVNERRVHRQLLKDGDQIRIGETELIFKAVGKKDNEKKSAAKKNAKRRTKAKKEESESENP